VDSNGAPLDKNSQNKLLEFFGDAVDMPTLLEQTVCIVTDTNGDQAPIQQDATPLNDGKGVKVANYACTVDL